MSAHTPTKRHTDENGLVQLTDTKKCNKLLDTMYGTVRYEDWCILEKVRILKAAGRVAVVKYGRGYQECSLWVDNIAEAGAGAHSERRQ